MKYYVLTASSVSWFLRAILSPLQIDRLLYGKVETGDSVVTEGPLGEEVKAEEKQQASVTPEAGENSLNLMARLTKHIYNHSTSGNDTDRCGS